MKLLLRWIITTLSLFVAAAIVPGIRVGNDAWTVYAAMALILGLVNATVRPLLKLLSCPLIILTLGLFALIINAIAFLFAASIAVSFFHVSFHVDTFMAAFLGSIVVSLVSLVMNIVVREI